MAFTCADCAWIPSRSRGHIFVGIYMVKDADWNGAVMSWSSVARVQYDSAGLMAFLHVTPRSHFSHSPHIWRVTAALWAIQRRGAIQSMSHQ